MVNFSTAKKVYPAKLQRSRGFTLIELLVSISIIGIILGVLFGSTRRYSERLILKNQAYSVVLAVREAQVSSLSVKPTGVGSSSNFNVSYGVALGGVSENKIVFFTDSNGNGIFDVGEPSEDRPFSRGIIIDRVCGLNNGGNESCSPVYRADVVFRRPDPTAVTTFIGNGGNPVGGLVAPARLYLTSPSGYSMVLQVDSTGGVSIR